MVSHTTTGEWQSFEGRMRRRRAERLILRAEAAAEAGCLDDARQCLAEARALDPRMPALAAVEDKIEKVETSSAMPDVEPAGRSRGRFAAAAVVAVAASIAVAAAFVLTRSEGAGDPVIAAAPLSASIPVPAVPSPEPLPSPVERFAAETAAAPAANLLPAVAEPQPPERPAEEIAPAPIPRTQLIPIAPAISDAIRQEVSAVATRTSALPDVPTVGALKLPVAADPAPPALKLPVAADPAPPAAAPAPAPSQEPAVRSVLDRYASAYSALDVDAAQRVWPGVNRGALARAFDSLESQHVSFNDCRIDVAGGTASALCSGTTSWSPKVGGGGSRTETRNWTFELARGNAGWEIVSARVQNR